MLCWSLPVPALQVSAAGVDLEAGKCGCRCVSVDICSFEDGVGHRDVGLRSVMYAPTRKGGARVKEWSVKFEVARQAVRWGSVIVNS